MIEGVTVIARPARVVTGRTTPKEYRPLHDPEYPYPGRVWYGGQWRTPEGVEAKREANRRWQNAYRKSRSRRG